MARRARFRIAMRAAALPATLANQRGRGVQASHSNIELRRPSLRTLADAFSAANILPLEGLFRILRLPFLGVKGRRRLRGSGDGPARAAARNRSAYRRPPFPDDLAPPALPSRQDARRRKLRSERPPVPPLAIPFAASRKSGSKSAAPAVKFCQRQNPG